MPQMAPMNWLILFSCFTVLWLGLLSHSYFN